jgi:uncharacterized RDD family membrane protein YckC
MDIWIIRNGERAGPIHDYEIRRRIEDDQIDPATPAWHEGLDSWRPLSEIDLFRNEFLKTPPLPAAAPTADAPSPGAAAAPPNLLLFRRFVARWFDLVLFAGIWWLVMWALGRDLLAVLLNPWVMLLQYLPWFVLESILLHYWGTTPGKWLLGLRLHNTDGSRLSLAQATRRSLRVLVLGIGFGWSFLALFCQVVSFFGARRLGQPLWDHVGDHRVTTSPLRPLRAAAFFLLFYGGMHLQVIVLYPYIIEELGKASPALQKQIEERPPFHLPRRNP